MLERVFCVGEQSSCYASVSVWPLHWQKKKLLQMKVWNGAPTLTTSCNRFIELYLELFPLSLNLQFLPSFLAVPAPTLGTIPCPGYIITGSRVPGYDTSALIRKKLRFFFSSRTVFYIFYSRYIPDDRGNYGNKTLKYKERF